MTATWAYDKEHPMNRYLMAVMGAAALAFSAVAGDDEPVNVYKFELKGGQKIEAYRLASLGAGDLKSYVLTTLDGEKLIVLENEIVSRKEEVIELDKLPERARKEVLKSRAAAAAARAEMEAQQKEQQAIFAAKRKETDARNELKKIAEDAALAKAVLANAEKIIKETPVEIAKLDAQYDAAKTELGGLSSSYVGGYGGVDHARADYLRGLMTRAAEDKVRLDQGKKEAQDVIARVQENLKVLEARMVIAKKDLETAQTEAKAAHQKAKDEARQREKTRETKGESQKEGPTLVTLKDGRTLTATSILEDPDGRVTIKDDQGKVHYLDAQDVIRRQTKSAK